MDELDPAAVQRVIREGLMLADQWDLRVESVGPQAALMRLPWKDGMERPGGSIAGPFIMGLADAAMWAAVMGRVGRLDMAVTANLNINFLARPHGCDLLARARIMKLGRRLAFCDVVVFGEGNEGTPVAQVTGSYALPGRSAR